MNQRFRFLFIIAALFFGYTTSVSAVFTFIPGPTIALTGANNGVYFDVADDLFGYSSLPPHLHRDTKTFSGSFYLSGAGWIQFDAPGYRVQLDCGIQLLDSLTLPCVLSGTGWSETIGDITFDKKLFYYPTDTTLSGTILTHIGVVAFSGIFLPIGPTFFLEGNTSLANHTTSRTLSGKNRMSDGPWSIEMLPVGYPGWSRMYDDTTLNMIDFSHAGEYLVTIRDPNQSQTIFSYTVTPGVPSMVLDSSASAVLHTSFCQNNPTHPKCPDGATIAPSLLKQYGSNLVADGKSYYNFDFSFRDRYGNIPQGTVQIEYADHLKDVQYAGTDGAPFVSFGSGIALNTSGSVWDMATVGIGQDTPTTNWIDLAINPTIRYGFASYAPTNIESFLTLKKILYKDAGITTSLPHSEIGSPITFLPWYSTSLAVVGDILIGKSIDFTTSLVNLSSEVSPTMMPIYGLNIGDNSIASFAHFSSSAPSPACTKESVMIGLGECNWFRIGTSVLPSMIATTASSFSGEYLPDGSSPQEVTYQSYITYIADGWRRFIYPSSNGTFGTAVATQSVLKILGQNNAVSHYFGIDTSVEVRNDFWNTVRKNVALLSRNRTIYTDVDYEIIQGASISLDATAFATKRTIVVVGGDVTITDTIPFDPTLSYALIVLSDASGNGGNIRIQPSVRDIHANLFAEKSVLSSGDNQLYIHGMVLSLNTIGKSIF